MTNRKNRLKKGIESLERQILLHRKKLEITIEEKKLELVDYYEREIIAKTKDKEKKEKLLKK